MFKLLFIIVSLLLFHFNYEICCYLYPDDPNTINLHYDLRFNIYAATLFFFSLSFYFKESEKLKKITKSVSLVYILTCASDVYDRYKGQTNFNYFDLVLLIIFIFIAIYNYARKN